jgi:hypothetical protein
VKESSQILRLDRIMALCQFVLDALSLLPCRSISVVMKDNTRPNSILYSESQINLPKNCITVLEYFSSNFQINNSYTFFEAV